MLFDLIDTFEGRKKVVSFQFGIPTPLVVFGLERTTLRMSLVVCEFENFTVHEKMAGRTD